MALTISSGGGGAGIGCIEHTLRPRTPLRISRHVILPHPSRTLHVVSAARKLSSQTGRFDSKRRRSLLTTTKEERDVREDSYDKNPTVQIGDGGDQMVGSSFGGNADAPPFSLSELPGQELDFWEGPQWDGLGFFVQYLWAFGIVFALISGGIAVATYNEGATDFKETPVYKEAIQSRELLEESEGSNSEVFESNPTEVAPSLE